MGGLQSTPQDIDLRCVQSIVYTLSQCRVEDVCTSYKKLKAVHYAGPDSSIDSNTLAHSLPVGMTTALELLTILSANDSEPVDIVGFFSTLLFFCHGALSEKLDLFFFMRGWKKLETALSYQTIQACISQLLLYTDRVYSADPWMKHTDEVGPSSNPPSFSSEIVREIQDFSGKSTATYSDLFQWLMASLALISNEDTNHSNRGTRNGNTSNNAATSPGPCLSRHCWLPITSDKNDPGPSSRSKHAIAVHGSYIYLYGGRDGSIGHKDLWRFEITSNKWQRLQCRGDRPNLLEEHSMIAHKGKLYVFGGEFSASWSREVPLWILDIATLVWRKHTIESEVSVPCSRRGQTAVVYGNGMHIYGGYMDLKGSSSELWTFDLEAGMWHLAYSNAMCADGPGSRHGHSAVVHNKAMWVYGGMSDLQPRGDFWRWDFGLRKWTKIKTKNGPPPLAGHTACKVPGALLLYGGEYSGVIQTDLWKFTFDTQTWQKITCSGVIPCGRHHHEAIVLPAFILNQAWLTSGTERARSVPHLRADQLKVRLDQRPSTSPSPATTNQDKPTTRHNFRNKVLPSSQDSRLVISTVIHGSDSPSESGSSTGRLSSTDDLGSGIDDKGRRRLLKDKLVPFKKCDSVEILNEEAFNSEAKSLPHSDISCQNVTVQNCKWSDIADHARIVRKHIHQIAKFKQIDTGSLSRLLSSNSDMSDDINSFDNPLCCLNPSEQFIYGTNVDGRYENLEKYRSDASSIHKSKWKTLTKSVSVETILSMGHNEALPPPYYFDHKRPRYIERDLLRSALRSKSCDSLLKSFSGVGLTCIDISEDPTAIELQSFDSDLIIEDLEGCDGHMHEGSEDVHNKLETSLRASPQPSKSDATHNVEGRSREGSKRLILDAWKDVSPTQLDFTEEHFASECQQKMSQTSSGSLPDLLLDIGEKTEADPHRIHSLDTENLGVNVSTDNGRFRTSTPSDMIEMEYFNSNRMSGKKQGKVGAGQTLKRYLCQRGIKPCDLVHMFVFGGKEADSSNIRIKPLPLWRLDISI